MQVLQANNIVIFKDDINEVPFLVHDVLFDDNNNPVKVSLGLAEYPEIEQDNYTDIDDVIKLTGKELKEARKKIEAMMF
jgi:hypothetical protein